MKKHMKKYMKKCDFSKRLKNEKGLKEEKRKSNRGITLIALVVTIIVLLILARCKYTNANRT